MTQPAIGLGGAQGDRLTLLHLHHSKTRLCFTLMLPQNSSHPQSLRELSPTVTAWAKEYRVPLSLFSTSNLAFVVWQTLSAARNTLLAQSPGPVFAMMGLALGQHVAYLIFNYLIVW